MDRKSIGLLAALFFMALASGCGGQISCDVGPCRVLDPREEFQENPTPPPEPEPAPPAPRDPADDEDFDVFRDVAYKIGVDVDGQYSRYRELLQSRAPDLSAFNVDSCEAALDGHTTFADHITHNVVARLNSSRSQLSYVGSIFGLPAAQKDYVPTGLISHHLCRVNAATLKVTYQNRKIPAAATIQLADRFSVKANEYRQQILSGHRDGRRNSARLWSKFMMCLSYTESLTTADSARSDALATKYGFRRPAGVKLYMDPGQANPDSQFNIGLFQFSPASSGSIQSCLREWNERYPRCQVKRNGTWKELLQALGSPLQTFNSFCGVSKVAGMFSVQVNTSRSKHVHPSNIKADGKLLPAPERCVSPFMNVNTSYNHFGPLQNSTGSNLHQVLSCVLKGDI